MIDKFTFHELQDKNGPQMLSVLIFYAVMIVLKAQAPNKAGKETPLLITSFPLSSYRSQFDALLMSFEKVQFPYTTYTIV